MTSGVLRLALLCLLLVLVAACGEHPLATQDGRSSGGEGDASVEEVPSALLHWSAVAPSLYYDVPEEEREARCRLLEETCVILGVGNDGEDVYCLLGDLHIDVHGLDQPLVLSTWVSVKEKTFRETRELWHEPDIVGKKYFAWFYNGYTAFEPKTALKANIEFTRMGVRPRIVLQPTDHPISVAAYEGISRERLDEVLNALAADQVAVRKAVGAGPGERR